MYRTAQNKQYIEQHNNLGECGLYPVLASYTLAFALQLRKKHGNRWYTPDLNIAIMWHQGR